MGLQNQKMLYSELKYWDIDVYQFRPKKNQIQVLQEVLDRPFVDLLHIKDNEPFFIEGLKQQRLNVEQLIKEDKLKFGKNFRITSIEEVIEVECNNQYTKIGRVCGYYNEDQSYVLYDGEFSNENALDGHGRYITTQHHLVGQFKDHQMHGKNKNTMKDGTIKEGSFKEHNMHGEGKIIFADGTVQDGDYKDGVFIKGSEKSQEQKKKSSEEANIEWNCPTLETKSPITEKDKQSILTPDEEKMIDEVVT